MPSTAAVARDVAAAAIAEHGELLADRTREEVHTLREACLEAHARAVESRIHRELEIAGSGPASVALQPGLFDRRAVQDATSAEIAREETRTETSHRMAQLRASAALEEHIDIRGLLILWTERT